MPDSDLPPSASSRRTTAVVLAIAMVASLFASLGASPPAEAQGPANFVFTGAGWGHGVGMSQNGARNMAEQGFTHVGILAFYYPNTVVSEPTPLGDIRVHVGDASRIELSSQGSITFERGGVAINGIPSGSISISAHDGGLQIGNAWTTASATDPVFVSFPMPVKVANNGHRYLWGRFQLTNRNGKVRVVEVLPLEDYVAGIAEMPAAWPLEALMAQAIAARTYAHEVTLHRRNSSEWAQEYDISGSTVDQNYIGYDAQDSQWDQVWLAAVKATAGVEIVDNNGPVRAYYSASNGGYTETAAYVFDNDVAHTVAGPDPYDAGGHQWTEWTRTYSQSAMSRWLNAHSDTSVGTLTAINLLGGEGASARLDKATVELVGTNGTKRITGKRLMLVINAGVFGGGGGLDDHLPGTFTTIGNGTGAGAPQPGGQEIPAAVTPDPLPHDTPDGFTPPPGWTPEAGTGTPPIDGGPDDTGTDADTDTDTSESESDTGESAEPESEEQEPEAQESEEPGGFTPPEGWTPEPGTGTPPIATPGTPESGTGTPPIAAPDTAETDTAETETNEPADEFTPPEGWTPEPGTGVPPASGVIGGTGGGFAPPPGWTPEPGTGVLPARTGSSTSTDTADTPVGAAVLLVTGGEDRADGDVARFEVIAPTDALADEARERLQELQSQAAASLFDNFDIDAYVAAVAPRPVQGVCTAGADGIICVPIAALRSAD